MRASDTAEELGADDVALPGPLPCIDRSICSANIDSKSESREPSDRVSSHCHSSTMQQASRGAIADAAAGSSAGLQAEKTAHEVPVLRRAVLRRQAGHRLPRVVELIQVLLRVAALPGVEQRPLLVVVQERLRGRCTLSCALGPAGAIVRLEPARQQNHSADRPVPAANSAGGLTNVRPTLAPASEWPDGIAGLGRSAHFSA